MNFKNQWIKVKAFIDGIKINIVALFIACKSKEVPLLAKLLAGLVVAYALSPVDLIPDFIPILGYLDDAVLLPLGIALAIRWIPAEVMKACRAEALQMDYRTLPKNKAAAAVIVLIWILLLGAAVRVAVGYQ